MNFRLHTAAILLTLASPAFSAGKELEGERAAAQSICPTPEEAQKKMSVPEGYEVRCFAHEPMVVNPVAMTWDSRGRLWVVEGYEYPNGSEYKNNAFGMEAKDDHYHPVPEICKAKDNPLSATRADHPKIPKDRIVILEDTDNDGIADKRTVFLEGLDMGSAILLGDGGVYVGQQPHLLHFKDTDGDDHADEWRVVLTGFGREDTHELLNSFCWGPDGWLYMTHGVFTNSKVRRPGEPIEKGFKFDAGLGRARPIVKRAASLSDPTGKLPVSPWEFEVFADGTSNPWGCDYDARGNFFCSACVIDHFFHLAPGGIYTRQGGAPENPYAYELLPSIVKHKHFRAAYAGVQIYQGGVYPADTHGHALIGNIHDNAVHEEVLTPVGATFKCEPRRDFLRANDGWFRPVSTQTGPDGNLWIMDWCDKYPCYQNAKANPEGVDRDRGRIWRVVYTPSSKADLNYGKPIRVEAKDNLGRPTTVTLTESRVDVKVPSRPERDMDLAKLSTPELVKLLGHSNSWMRRMARRQLVERKDEKAKPLLEKIARSADKPAEQLDALWTLHQTNLLEGKLLDQSAHDADAGVRSWAARLSGERFRVANQHLADVADDDFMHTSEEEAKAAELMWPELERIQKLEADKDITVRFATATGMRMASSAALTANRPLPHEAKCFRPLVRTFYMMNDLMKASAKGYDALLQFEIWMCIERGLDFDPVETVHGGQLSIAAECEPLSDTLVYKAMRRLCEKSKEQQNNINLAVAFCEKIQSHDILLAHALDGLVKGQEAGALKPTVDVSKPLATWRESKNPDVAQKALQLAVLWGDKAAIKHLVAVMTNPKAPNHEVLYAMQTLRKTKDDVARSGFVEFLNHGGPFPASFTVEAIRASADLGGDAFIAPLTNLAASKDYGVRLAALESLSGRANWAHTMLDAIAANKISGTGFPASVRRQLATNVDKSVRDHAFKVLGAWKESSDETKAIITAKRKACLEGEPDLAQGKITFTTTCAVCHSFYGGGQKVGPDLIGSGRSNLDALLANVIDPNQIIGNGYENINVTTKDGRTVSGRMVEDTPSGVKLLAIAGAEQIVPRDQIASLVNTHQSVMPVGFGALPDDVFRNLVWYVLAPPDEGPLTNEKKDALSRGVEGAESLKKKASGNNSRAIDWESINLWNPAWAVEAPDFERTPMKLPEFHGRQNVLLMHPFTKDKPCSLERKVKIEKDKMNKLSFFVASHDQGDWELRVKVDGEVVKKETIGHDGERWKHIEMDLVKYAGKEVTLRLEGAANGWSWEFSYWSDVKVE